MDAINLTVGAEQQLDARWKATFAVGPVTAWKSKMSYPTSALAREAGVKHVRSFFQQGLAWLEDEARA